MDGDKEYIKKGSLVDEPELSWTFLDNSKRTAVILKTCAIGRGEYLPGWKWSEHAGKITRKESEAHIGYILSGEMIIKKPDGKEEKVGPNEVFEIQSGHDAWVVGNESCIALDFQSLENKDD